MDLALKICGMRDPENIDQVALLHPDYLGLIFFEGSPRYISGTVQALDPEIRKTGVFVNASEEYIVEKVQSFQLAAIQLHGEESPAFCRRLQSRFSAVSLSPKLIKVFSLKDTFDEEVLKPYQGLVDFFLFDTRGANRGGNGITFDWDILRTYSGPVPFFLSGGIGPEAVPAIRKLYRDFERRGLEHLLHGIDINSKFEISPGLKDPDTIRTFRKELFPETTNTKNT